MPALWRRESPFSSRAFPCHARLLAPDPLFCGVWQTSIVFTLEEAPGALFKALAVFSLRDINLTKVRAHPHCGRALTDRAVKRPGSIVAPVLAA